MKIRYAGPGKDDVVEVDVAARLVVVENEMVLFKDAQANILLLVPSWRLIDAVESTDA